MVEIEEKKTQDTPKMMATRAQLRSPLTIARPNPPLGANNEFSQVVVDDGLGRTVVGDDGVSLGTSADGG